MRAKVSVLTGPVRSVALLILGVLLAGPVDLRAAEDPLAEYFNQLRQRRLFGLAEGYGLDQLARDDLSPARRAALTRELARTFTAHARHTTGREQSDLWNRAGRVLDEFLETSPDHPLRLPLEVQRALIPASRGEFLARQAELFPEDETLRDRAETTLSKAVSELIELEDRLRERLEGVRDRMDEESLGPFQLHGLQRHLRYQVGIALLNRARLLPNDSPDRAADLIDAEERFDALAGGIPGEELTWKGRLRLAEVTRLRGAPKQALQILATIEADDPPEDVLDGIVAERVRCVIDRDGPTEAAQLLLDYEKRRGPLPGELRFLKAKAIVGLWETARNRGRPELAEKLFRRIEQHTRRAERDVGGYWGYRCRLLWDLARQSRDYGPELASLIRKARTLYTHDEIEESVETYRKAAEKADGGGRTGLAVELRYTAASILLKDEQYERAAAELERLVEQHASSRRAASAHLLRAWCLGRLYRRQPTKTRRLTYTEALERHRERFAGDPTAAEATWMLARLQESRLQTTQALKLYLQIPEDHRRGEAARAAVARCYERILQRLRELNKPDDSWERDAIDRLESFAADFPAPPASLNRHQAQTAVRLARILLNRDPPRYDRADELLARVFASSQAAIGRETPSAKNETAQSAETTAWKTLLNESRLLRIVSQSGQGQPREAGELLQRLSETHPADLLSILHGLTELAVQAEGSLRRDLGELQLQAAEKLQQRRETLNEPQQRRLQQCLALAYLATNQPTKGLETYAPFLNVRSPDRSFLETAARLLADCGTKPCWEKARQTWRRVESMEESGSREWLEARYQRAVCLLELQRDEEARKLVEVTRLLYPDLGHSELRGRFKELERRIQRRDAAEAATSGR